ncbi:MAG TPA: hypothetical protein VEK37_15815 [Gemmatimonadaceae bacterium]|nr:hypothetical protein [Gemmatimonadaceae bacterium]
MSDMNDDEFRGRFSALRQQDRHHEPPFRDMLNGAELRGRVEVRSAPSLRWIAAAASIVIAAGFVIGKAQSRGDEPPVATRAPAITSWQSPTAGLLQAPSRALIAPAPLLSSVFDGVTQTALQSKSD